MTILDIAAKLIKSSDIEVRTLAGSIIKAEIDEVMLETIVSQGPLSYVNENQHLLDLGLVVEVAHGRINGYVAATSSGLFVSNLTCNI